MLCLIFWISAPTTASPKPFRTSRQHVAEALRAALTPRLIHTEGHVLSALLAAANAPKFSWIYDGFDHKNHGLEHEMWRGFWEHLQETMDVSQNIGISNHLSHLSTTI